MEQGKKRGDKGKRGGTGRGRSRVHAGAFLAAALFLSALTTACGGTAPGSEGVRQAGGESGAAASTEGETAGELRELDVVLDWYPNAIHSFLYTAAEKGYYEAEGLKINIRFPANDNDGLALVAAGKAELSLYYQQDLIQAVANQNAGVRSVGAVCQAPLNIILSMKEKNVRRPADFSGKIVGYGGTALSEAMVKALMKYDGADPETVGLQNVGFDLMSAMTTGRVDATIGCLVNHELPQLEEEGFEMSWFPLTDYGLPNFYELCLVANEELTEKEPEILAAFLRASERGFEDFKADPEGSLQILLDNQSAENFPLSPTVEKKSAEILLPLMEQEGKPFLSQSEECWRENIDWMYEQGLISRRVDVSEVTADPGR